MRKSKSSPASLKIFLRRSVLLNKTSEKGMVAALISLRVKAAGKRSESKN